MKRFTIKNSMILFFLLIIAPGKTILSQVSEQWVAKYTTNTGVTGTDYDRANSVAIDEAGYVYVTGASYCFRGWVLSPDKILFINICFRYFGKPCFIYI